MKREDSNRFYYLHTLLAGPIADWGIHFARISRLGFSHVVVAPPFLPGRSGNILLVADHARLHGRLGQQNAETALRAAVVAAAAHGLVLVLDLVINRAATDGVLARAFAGHGLDDDAPPDPRLSPADRFASALKFDCSGALEQWWQERLATWLDLGIAGFRCVDAHRSPPAIWTRLITGARAREPEALFIAWFQGAPAEAARRLAPCGFDLAASSSWAWDFRADWIEADTRRTAAVGRLMAMPEVPFGARLAATPSRAAAYTRALRFAGAFGPAWLMPMGFEFGARQRLDLIHGQPADFEALAAAPVLDLADAITEVNAIGCRSNRRTAPMRLVSAPASRIAALVQDTGLLLANAELERSSVVPVAELTEALDGAALPDDLPPELAPGEIRMVTLHPANPITVPPPDAGAIEAVGAPRIAIEAIKPRIEGDDFPVKRIVGQTVEVSADIICDGHETLAAALQWREAGEAKWHEMPLVDIGNDRWSASFRLRRPGRHEFAVLVWQDVFGAFRYEMTKKHGAGLDLSLELREGALLVQHASDNAGLPALRALSARLAKAPEAERLETLMSAETAALMEAADSRPFLQRSPTLGVDAERIAAGFANWYEIFPRSQSPIPGKHGTFIDVIARLPDIADLGFDVLYFPPVHPIGRTNRKGRNNSLQAGPDDPGSPYAIGSAEGGHDALHPELGTLQDFRRLVAAAAAHGIELALDFAIQCSPDHPWLRDHPEWFTWRPDGSIRYAENPPKKYEDIVNVDFYADGAKPSLWIALRDAVLFWVDQGVRIFRVDNPHTKPFPFWEWMIGDIRARHPEIIFLAEAFTRPKVMYRLAKVGFSQSYTYFTWRNTAYEMREYLTELATSGPREFFRPHFFVNTPDINPIFLHDSGRPGFLLRAALAATLSGLWGVYNGFELCESASLRGREEYLNSEKYEIRAWDRDRPGHIRDEIRQLNHIRATNPALHTHLGVTFLPCSNDSVLCFAKLTPSRDNIVVAAISFDPRAVQEVDFELAAVLLAGPPVAGAPAPGVPLNLAAEDLMRGGLTAWQSGWRRARLDPADLPFALWRVRIIEG